MKLFYYQAPGGNIGDDLNAWLWPKLLNPILDNNESQLIIGIGTLLNHKIPKASQYYVLSSGWGYGEPPELDQGEWNFIALRGPLTKDSLGCTGNIPLLDGAYLLPLYLKTKPEKRYKFSYIPHVDSIHGGHWEEVCNKVGIHLLDPRLAVGQFVEELCSTEYVITEAMHGAILADAYGIPWTPAKAYSYINEYKWNDWAKTVDVKVNFNYLPSLWRGDKGENIKRKSINQIKRLFKKMGVFPKSWTPVLPARSSRATFNKAANTLKQISESAVFQVSNRDLTKRKVLELKSAVELFVKNTQALKNNEQ